MFAFEELAKYYEHHAEDVDLALRWTQEALDLLEVIELPNNEKLQWQSEFKHRLERLKRKISTETK
jgi:hypothetical protein